ncbi:protein AATF [Zerene cesonia]|uniref:protein AATF n=1 Tax=Zerene cesonia TaxID=33412 RepID=UPI0018E53163|nr:protein AATF [Zerene cesonia]
MMKFKQKKNTKQTLSDRIADALTIKPRADIEDDEIFNTKPSTVTRADYSSSSDEDETVISDFRKRNVNLLSDISKKYEGKVVSKKELEENSSNDQVSDDESDNNENEKETKPGKGLSSEEDTGDESDDYSITKFQKQLQSDSDDEKSSDNDDGDQESDESDNEGEGYDISQMEEPIKEQFEHVKKQDVSEEAKKGICVRNQLLIWEGLLEMRIHLQRCMSTANKMPMSNIYKELKVNNDFAEESSKTINNVSTILDKFLTLQSMLLKNFPDTKSLSKGKQSQESKAEEKKKESDEEIPSDTDNEEIPSDTDNEEPTEENKEQTKIKRLPKKRKLDDYEGDIATCYKSFKSFRDSTIQKWNDKTRVATAANIKNAPTNTILQQISYILSDREKLIKRTQLKRSEYDIIGYKKEISEEENGPESNPITRSRKDDDEYIPEIFDDSDFYHQLLRELIECKSADITDPVQLSRQWITLQQMRSKMKRKVDTKATKGRKIKYVVHNPLVSYMAPEKLTKWNEESANELYSSLFGKIFEHNNVGLNVTLDDKK